MEQCYIALKTAERSFGNHRIGSVQGGGHFPKCRQSTGKWDGLLASRSAFQSALNPRSDRENIGKHITQVCKSVPAARNLREARRIVS